MATRKTNTATMTASHSAAANLVLQKIRSLRTEIPGFTQPQSAREEQRLIANASVPDEFHETVSVAVGSSPALAAASGVNPDDVRDAIRFSAAYSPVADELEAVAHAVRHTIALRRAAAAQETLAAYDLAKGLARRPESADLVPHIADMRRTLKRSGTRRKASAKPATP